MRILGLDPALTNTGWGVIESEGSRLSYVASGTIRSTSSDPMEGRLSHIHKEILSVIESLKPDQVAIEETFVNKNPASALKLGMARGVIYMTPALVGLSVSEYPANVVKKTVVGVGHAKKEQVQMMVKTLLPKSQADSADAADALAIAICHSQHSGLNRIVEKALIKETVS